MLSASVYFSHVLTTIRDINLKEWKQIHVNTRVIRCGNQHHHRKQRDEVKQSARLAP